jgi:hypothetical protein
VHGQNSPASGTVYQSLTTDQVAEVETIALDRRQFFREPAA